MAQRGIAVAELERGEMIKQTLIAKINTAYHYAEISASGIVSNRWREIARGYADELICELRNMGLTETE